MATAKTFLIVAFSIAPFLLLSQNVKQKIFFSDIIARAADRSSKDTVITTTDANISFENIPRSVEFIPGMNFTVEREMPIVAYLLSKYDSSRFTFDENGRLLVPALLEFDNCSFQGYNYDGIRFEGGVYFNKPTAYGDNINTPYLFWFNNCYFSELQMVGQNDDYTVAFGGSEMRSVHLVSPPSLQFVQNTIYTGVIEGVNNPEGSLVFESNTFASDSGIPTFELDSLLPENIGFKRNATYGAFTIDGRQTGFLAGSGRIKTIELYKNVLKPIPDSDRIPHLSISNIEMEDLSMTENLFDGDFNFVRNRVPNGLEIVNNVFNEKVSFTRSSLSELMSIVPWDQLSGNKLYLRGDLTADSNPNGYQISNFISYYGQNDIELASKIHFESLISSYRTFFEIYKFRGDIESANACYAEMKDIQTRRLGYLYKTDRTLKSWFTWRLGQLMKVYTDHGTDPAKAVLISFYILLGFAVFYFFFPSEWDVTSKNDLLRNLKEAFDSKQPGTFKSIMKACGMFALSFLNAITLSLNSFVTLGFGTIPTTGLARYVCILQGFLGWFLLSLFSVALINQVLF